MFKPHWIIERTGDFIKIFKIFQFSKSFVNDIWRDIESKIRLFADDCIIYRKILNIKDVEKLQTSG